MACILFYRKDFGCLFGGARIEIEPGYSGRLSARYSRLNNTDSLKGDVVEETTMNERNIQTKTKAAAGQYELSELTSVAAQIESFLKPDCGFRTTEQRNKWITTKNRKKRRKEA